MASREQFEAWYKSKYLFQGYEFDRLESGSYQWIESMWQAWQASRSAIEIEAQTPLTTRDALNAGYSADYATGVEHGIRAMEQAIEQAGLKVKQ